MFTPHRSLLTIALLCSLTAAAPAQTKTPKARQEPTPAPLVTAAAEAARVRFITPTAAQLRLEVYDEAGQKVFDTEQRGGNVLDWTLQDGQGERVAAGTYACLLTVKSLAGRLSQRLGLVTVTEQAATVQPAATAQLSLAQAQAVGPVESDAGVAVLQAGESLPATVVAHDGRDGQVARTHGALSFRVGDFFSGLDKEQMRLTETGDLGLGTRKPEARLDVVGDIHASGTVKATQGIEFADGTVQTTGLSGRKDKDGNIIPAATGTGTQDRLAKWLDNAGTLGDAAIAETNGLFFFGQNYAGQVAPLFSGAQQFHVLEVGIAPSTRTPLVLAGGSGSIEFWKDLGGGMARPTAAGAVGLGAPGMSPTNDLIFSTYTPTTGWNERARMTAGGNFGVGTTTPQSKLDVAGEVNTLTHYNIRNSRVVSVAGFDNSAMFVGVGAGAANTTGRFNAFFGFMAGAANTDGVSNSFFGSEAGRQNTFGFANSFFGRDSGRANTTGVGNSFFGTSSGGANSTGEYNSFFGSGAGIKNTTGRLNAFLGIGAGSNNVTGERDTYIGAGTGISVTQESNNTLLGAYADGRPGVNNATAIGAQAVVTQSNSLVLGSVRGVNGATANINVGIGTTAPKAQLHVQGGSLYVGAGGQGVILKSPDGATCRLLSIDNTGSLTTTPITCP